MVLVIIAGLLFCGIGYIYATHTAGSLPGFFPGYQAGATNIHGKHSLAAFIVGLGCFVYAWFLSGPKQT